MRVLGVVLFLAGAIGAALALKGSFDRRRPLDVLLAVAAPAALALALVGAVLVFVPDFFG